ncbi:MAG TPA: tetratricopeptide repeat protein [Anaerolineae bacterium]|nr:tetratricopeptide repeat protein [Anaerolineae bacterium]HMR68138.1 tetratricopeptide repeat protein [Anaerolineae bacterium]
MISIFTVSHPLGIFPLPAGYLLLPPADGSETPRAELLQGRLPPDLPPEWQFFQAALTDDLDQALALLAADLRPEARYNRFVLNATPEQYATLLAEFEGELRQLLDLVAYTLGYLPAPPGRGLARAERLALILMAQATHALEHQQPAQAVSLLAEAVELARPVSPVLAAQLLGTLADTKFAQGGPDWTIIQDYQAAIKALEGSDLVESQAELWLNLGIVYQDLASDRRGPLLEAVKCYQQALSVFTRRDHPELYALAQNNLALAYLSMPLQEAGDQLRMGIAVQALREALKVYRRESHPEQWASAQLNLANAYQYLPSAHPEENLAQAVELYEEVLATRHPQTDPLGYARVLANQGNALAHLGIFVHALPKLTEAQSLFAAYGDPEAARSIAQLLEQIPTGASHGTA